MFVVIWNKWTNAEIQDCSKVSQMTNRVDCQAAVVETTNVIHTLNTSAYHNSGYFSAEQHQLSSHDHCYAEYTLASHTEYSMPKDRQ